MAYIESHQELRDHPKVKRMARMLDVPVVAVIGHLQCLWWWAMDYAQDGDTSRYDAHDLADASLWDGDPDVLVAALRDCGPGGTSGFLDGDQLHDWDQHSGRRLRMNRERNRITQTVRRTVIERDGRRCRRCGAGGQSTQLHVDHVMPLALGGTSDPENLQALCRLCNLSKGAKHPADWGVL